MHQKLEVLLYVKPFAIIDGSLSGELQAEVSVI